MNERRNKTKKIVLELYDDGNMCKKFEMKKLRLNLVLTKLALYNLNKIKLT